MQYDDLGRMTASIDGEGNISRYGYDAGDNILWIKDPLSLVDPDIRHRVDFTYDDRGNQTSFKDANNNLTKFTYDDMNSLTAVRDALDSTTSYGYDENYNLESVKDAEGNVTGYGYDFNNRLKSITDSTSKTVQYRYDPAGNLNTVVYPNGNENYFDYTSDSLLAGVSYKNQETSYSFEYNPLHALTKVVDNESKQWIFDYDEGNRLTVTQENTNSAVETFTVNRGYDSVSNLTELNSTGDSTLVYSYNDINSLVGIDIPGGETTEISFGYDKARKRTSTIMPGNISRVGYDVGGRVTTMTNEISAGIQGFNYRYDANGNIADVMLSDSEASQTTRYAYDKLNRLTGWYDSIKDATTTYRYDKVGNLLEVKDGQTVTKSFSYNAANQINSAGYLYDDNGNMIEGASVEGSGSRGYKYDSENRLSAVINKSTDSTMAEYAYDFMGRRTSSTDSSSQTTYFHYDGWNVVAESDNSGNITANYYYDSAPRKRGKEIDMIT